MAAALLVLLALAAVGQIADGITTWRALAASAGRELNPAMVWLMVRVGTGPALILAKGLGLALIAIVAWLVWRQPMPWWGYAAALVVVLVSIAAPIINLIVAGRSK